MKSEDRIMKRFRLNFPKEEHDEQWLRTPAAALAIGCSQNHLKRCRDSHGGFLVGGEDYILGSSRSAAIIWNVERVRLAFHHRGMLSRTDKTETTTKEEK